MHTSALLSCSQLPEPEISQWRLAAAWDCVTGTSACSKAHVQWHKMLPQCKAHCLCDLNPLQNVSHQKVRLFGEAFAKIQDATGISDIDDLVKAFASAEVRA